MSRKTLSQLFILAVFLLASLVVPVTARAGGVCGGTFTAEKGDTLEKIAATCGTTVAAILAANPGMSTTLKTGQTFVVPGINYIPTTAVPTTPAPTMPPPPPTNAPDVVNNYNNTYNYNFYGYLPGGYSGIYIVQPGDTFSGIAARYGVSLYELWGANPQIWDVNYIYAGQLVYVPASGGQLIYAPASYWTPVPASAATAVPTPSELLYGENGDYPKGKIKFYTKTKLDVYISMDGTTPDGYHVINEYPVNSNREVRIAPGWYVYVAFIGDKKVYGQFNMKPNGNISITFTDNSSSVSED